jgi:hypothetical protein
LPKIELLLVGLTVEKNAGMHENHKFIMEYQYAYPEKKQEIY